MTIDSLLALSGGQAKDKLKRESIALRISSPMPRTPSIISNGPSITFKMDVKAPETIFLTAPKILPTNLFMKQVVTLTNLSTASWTKDFI